MEQNRKPWIKFMPFSLLPWTIRYQCFLNMSSLSTLFHMLLWVPLLLLVLILGLIVFSFYLSLIPSFHVLRVIRPIPLASNSIYHLITTTSAHSAQISLLNLYVQLISEYLVLNNTLCSNWIHSPIPLGHSLIFLMSTNDAISHIVA